MLPSALAGVRTHGRALRMLDLFCGLGGASAAQRERGWEVIGVDNESRLQPDVVADVVTWRYEGPEVDFVWASPPCVEFAKTDKRCWYPDAPEPSMELVEAALRIIGEVKPRLGYLLENVRGARRWFLDHPALGAPVLQSPPLYLWGCPPPGLLLPSPGRGHKEHQSRSSADPRAMRLTSDERRRQLRAVVPYQISYSVATACERFAARLEAHDSELRNKVPYATQAVRVALGSLLPYGEVPTPAQRRRANEADHRCK